MANNENTMKMREEATVHNSEASNEKLPRDSSLMVTTNFITKAINKGELAPPSNTPSRF